MLPETCYSAFGLTVMSAVPLPDLQVVQAPASPDVSVRRGAVAAEDGGPLPLRGDAHRAVLAVPDVARYEIREGREIVVDPHPSADERHVRLFLLGSAFGVLLHQRQLLPLHANAVELKGRAVAFAGRSGAGKSTLAAWFHDRGRRVLSDDVCVIGWRAPGEPVAHPGIPRLRLWRDALQRSGRSADRFEPTWPDDESYDKFDVPLLARNDESKALPIGAIYLLSEGDGPMRIDRLRGSAAVAAVISNTYRGAFVAIVGDSVAHWRQCHALAVAVPIFRVTRSFDPANFEEDARAIEAHALEQVEFSACIQPAAATPEADSAD